MSERIDGERTQSSTPTSLVAAPNNSADEADLDLLLLPLPTGIPDVPVDEIAETLHDPVLSNPDCSEKDVTGSKASKDRRDAPIFRATTNFTVHGTGASIVQNVQAPPCEINDIGVPVPKEAIHDIGIQALKAPVENTDDKEETCPR